MVFFLPSTFGFISGRLWLSVLKFLATLPKVHLFLQTKKMLAYQTSSDPLVRNETYAVEKLQSH